VPNIGLPELIVILVIVVLLFGTSKLPQLGKGLGDAIRNFKGAMKEGEPGPKDSGDSKPK